MEFFLGKNWELLEVFLEANLFQDQHVQFDNKHVHQRLFFQSLLSLHFYQLIDWMHIQFLLELFYNFFVFLTDIGQLLLLPHILSLARKYLEDPRRCKIEFRTTFVFYIKLIFPLPDKLLSFKKSNILRHYITPSPQIALLRVL